MLLSQSYHGKVNFYIKTWQLRLLLHRIIGSLLRSPSGADWAISSSEMGEEGTKPSSSSSKVEERETDTSPSLLPSSYSSNDKKEVANFSSSSSFRLDKWPPDCTALFCVLQLLLLLLFFCFREIATLPSSLPPSSSFLSSPFSPVGRFLPFLQVTDELTSRTEKSRKKLFFLPRTLEHLSLLPLPCTFWSNK